ncbi:MAG: hypothetical protein U0522_02610 [Candidatus Paceibacterota bacterium]
MAIRKPSQFDRLTQETRRQILMHDNPFWVCDYNGNENTLGHVMNDIQSLIWASHDFGINPLSVLTRQFPAFEWKYHNLQHNSVTRFLQTASRVDYVWLADENGDFTQIVTALQVARAEPRRLCLCPLVIERNSVGEIIQTITNPWCFHRQEHDGALKRHNIRLLSFHPYRNEEVVIE